MSDVSLCVYCWYPIIFRYRPPRMYHMPSGWHCWSGRRGGSGARSVKHAHRRIPTTTPIKERRPLVAKAVERCEAYLGSGNPKPLLVYLKRELRAHRGDVVRDFLGYLAEPEMESRERDSLVLKLIATPEWHGLVEEVAEAA